MGGKWVEIQLHQLEGGSLMYFLAWVFWMLVERVYHKLLVLIGLYQMENEVESQVSVDFEQEMPLMVAILLLPLQYVGFKK